MLTEEELKIKTDDVYSENIVVAKTLGVYMYGDIVDCQYILYIRGEEISVCNEYKFEDITSKLESKGVIVKYISETIMPPC